MRGASSAGVRLSGRRWPAATPPPPHGDGAVYLVSDGTRRWIPSRLVLGSWRYPAARIRADLPAATVARVPVGRPLP